MAEQVKNGKAFEFALAETYYDSIKKLGVPVVLHQDKQYDNCKECLGSFDKDAKNRFKMSALVTVDTLFKLEPGLFADTNQNNPINIRIAKDEEGRNGDVRDVIVYRDSPSWTIGFSAKNNNDAVKHSRLSAILDFGKEWLNVPVSKQYWSDIEPIFGMIDNIQKRNPDTTCDELGQKKELEIYVPLLEAFRKELLCIYENNDKVPQKLISYLIGRYPFYKIIKDDTHNLVIVKAYNIEGGLNKTVNGEKARYKTPKINLPTRIVEFERHNSTNTLYMILDGGWEISFRIHNASTKLERSLKFDIRLLGNPPILFTQHIFQ